MMTDCSLVAIAGDDDSLLLISDHASSNVPSDIDLKIDPAFLMQHIAIDIGVAPLARRLCSALGCPGILGGVSRLVIDLNREMDSAGLIPTSSDGCVIQGNTDLSDEQRAERAARFWTPYHAYIADHIQHRKPALLLSLHSFTPQLAGSHERRPWEVGILYNRDDRAAQIALPMLRTNGAITGDNEPYSGKLLNATMNLHGEANGVPYLGIEVRQDLISDDRGVARWADMLEPVLRATRDSIVGKSA